MLKRNAFIYFFIFIIAISCYEDESQEKRELSELLKKKIINRIEVTYDEMHQEIEELEVKVLSHRQLSSIGIDSARLNILQGRIDDCEESIRLIEIIDGDLVANAIKLYKDSINNYIKEKAEFESRIPTLDKRIVYEAAYSMKGKVLYDDYYMDVIDTNKVFFDKNYRIIIKKEL